MAVNLNSTPYPPNVRPQMQTPPLGVVGAAATPVVRIGQMVKAANLNASFGAGTLTKAGMFGKLAQALNPMGLLRSGVVGALISFPLAAIQNFMDLKAGNVTEKQFLAATVADGAAYTAAGVAGSTIGALLGSIVPVAGTFIGMAVGALVGMGLSAFYESQFKPKMRQEVEAAMFGG
jgi:putative exporter of polyketide antibiotics